MLRRPAVVIATLVALGTAATPYAPGLSFTIRSSVSTDGVSRPAGAGTRVCTLKGVLRFESDEAKQSSGGKGSFVLVNPAAKTVSMVMPDQQQYIEINFADSATQAMGAMASMLAATTVVSDIEVSGTSLGGGGMVNRWSTNRYRINTSYAEVTGGGAEQRKMKLVEEFWVTNELKDIPDPMEAFTRAFGGQNGMPQIGGTMADLIRKRGDAQRRLFTGLPIKSVVKSTLIERDGSTKEEITTTEIVDLKRVDVDEAAFRVPPAYKKMDMKSLTDLGAQMRNALRRPGGKSGSGMTQNADGSVIDEFTEMAKKETKDAIDEAKQETKDGAKDAAKGQVDAAKDKAKCALGGMFGRKKC